MAKPEKTIAEPISPIPFTVVEGSLIPQVEAPAIPFSVDDDPLTDDKFTHGLYKDRRTGEAFALYLHNPDGYEKTHSLKNSVHFRQLVESEFFLQFEKA
jgi:hypothetical protein